MRKLLEIEINDEVRKQTFLKYMVGFLTISLFFLVRTIDRSYFDIDFYLELIGLFMVIKFYFRSQKNKNYAFWGFSLALGLYILKNILHYTFIEHNIFILYFSFLALLFLLLNSYVMSSPLYYPRIQWWEYDFRYRGELKGKASFQGKEFEIRLNDLRRGCSSIFAFEILPLGSKLKMEIPYNNKIYELAGTVKTLREVIPGRPIGYGILLNPGLEKALDPRGELKKIWAQHKKANLRRKFSDLKESSGV